MEEDCSIDLLTVEDEATPQNMLKGPNRIAGQITCWYVGTYFDGVIPDISGYQLATLKNQKEELKKRVTVRDYGKLRNRLFKYANTVRIVSLFCFPYIKQFFKNFFLKKLNSSL